MLPSSPFLSTSTLGKVFNNTTATYKFFWFISILQMQAKSEERKINVWDILLRMVANAWYPIHYFRLSFGRLDSLFDIVVSVQQMTQIPIDANVEQVIEQLKAHSDNKQVRDKIKILAVNVPYRFLSPWISTSVDRDVVARSQNFESGCLYALHKKEKEFYIEINPDWCNYLRTHYNILKDFAYWNLTLFLQTRNPNVPGIPMKLMRPDMRNSLTSQRKYWDLVIGIGGPIKCIYTGKELHVADYDLDHFIPWSFVSHDLLWNLIPSNGSINSSKSDRLPSLDYFLPKLAHEHQRAISVAMQSQKKLTILDDYVSLGYTPQELTLMDADSFLEVYRKTFSPLCQIAQNMGFEKWQF